MGGIKHVTIADWLMVVAVVLSPIIAVQVQKMIESFREKRGRKLQLFRTLMATRGSRLSPLHVEARLVQNSFL